MTNSSLILKDRLSTGPTLVMPDAYDPLSAKLIVASGFEAVQCSGYSMAHASGYSTETNLSYSENLEITRKIINAVQVPVMADGEDGFGDKAKLCQTVREYIRIGAAGVNIEDQVLGEWDGSKGVVTSEQMIEKLKLAREVAVVEGNTDFIINARTDALSVMPNREDGMSEAIRRAKLYLQAGADLAFVTGVSTLDEALTLRREVGRSVSIAVGLPYNMHISLKDLKRIDVARVSLPILPLLAAVRGMKAMLAQLASDEDFTSMLSGGLVAPEDLMDKKRPLNPAEEKQGQRS